MLLCTPTGGSRRFLLSSSDGEGEITWHYFLDVNNQFVDQ
jgi:hypothetical protein